MKKYAIVFVQSFWQTDQQTNQQRNMGDNLSSLGEVIISAQGT